MLLSHFIPFDFLFGRMAVKLWTSTKEKHSNGGDMWGPWDEFILLNKSIQIQRFWRHVLKSKLLQASLSTSFRGRPFVTCRNMTCATSSPVPPRPPSENLEPQGGGEAIEVWMILDELQVQLVQSDPTIPYRKDSSLYSDYCEGMI